MRASDPACSVDSTAGDHLLTQNMTTTGRVFDVSPGADLTRYGLQVRWGTAPSDHLGGLVCVIGAALRAEALDFGEGHATDGGCIYAEQADVALVHVTFDRCDADQDGAGLAARGGSLSWFVGSMDVDAATGSGGCVLLDGVPGATFTSAGFHTCNAGVNGGGVWVGGGDLVIDASAIEIATAGAIGGGLYASSDAVVDVIGSSGVVFVGTYNVGTSMTTGGTNLNMDPLFAPLNQLFSRGQFRLGAGSPAIDHAVDSTATDMDTIERLGLSGEAGAFEWVRE